MCLCTCPMEGCESLQSGENNLQTPSQWSQTRPEFLSLKWIQNGMSTGLDQFKSAV